MKTLVKHGLRQFLRSAPFDGFTRGLTALGDSRPGLLRVLTYHRVDDPNRRPDLDPRLISATPGEFATQVDHLARHARVVSLDDVRRAVRDGEPLPPKAVLITFDDAYEDFALHAWPRLHEAGLPATMFVATAFVDDPNRPFWWDHVHRHVRALTGLSHVEREAESRRLGAEISAMPSERVDELLSSLNGSGNDNGVLRRDELERLADDGLTLAPHTVNHPLLRNASIETARGEVCDSSRWIAALTGEQPFAFAYPGGSHKSETLDVLASAGIEIAFTTCRGTNGVRNGSTDALRLRRFNVGRSTSLAVLRAELRPEFRLLNRLWPMRETM